jgi:arginine N-succinyltransferase
MSALTIRPATAADLPALATLLSRPGLPAPLPRLPSAPQDVLLVAEQAAEGDTGARLLACARLRGAIGLDLPRYSYHVGCAVHAARDLNLFHRQRTLLLGNDHTGASELADLACAPDGVALADQAAALRLTVQTALLLLARARAQYAPQLIAEMPGLRDGAGQSPFWQGLGRHFYAGDPALAAARLGDAWRSHVAALLPRHAVYTSFLPDSAQAAIAQVQPEARLQREVLEAAGLHYGHHVSIDDGGPVLEADVDTLPAVTTSRVWTLASAAHRSGASAGRPYLVLADAARGPQSGWRAARLLGGEASSRLLFDAEQMATLGLAAGDTAWALPL